MSDDNKMRAISIGKVTVNMGVGKTGKELENADEVMKRITGCTTVLTKGRVKQPKWDIRPGLTIGVKTTMRKAKAHEFLTKALEAKDNILKEKQFDLHGNFGFGIPEYIDIPGAKYDPKLGIMGMDVLVTLERPGYRVKRRKIRHAKLGKKHVITKQDAIEFARDTLKVTFE
jgi:large subunit ribosomal protein L5